MQGDISPWQTTGAEMKRWLKKSRIGNEKGLAILETVPLIVVFVLLFSFGMGFFGVIHTATLHSIGARAYSFETFRQRTNLYYFREDGSGLDQPFNFSKKGWRYHAVNHESDTRTKFVSTTRPITIGKGADPGDAGPETHNLQIYELQARNQRYAVNPVWVMVGYGICLNAGCGNQ